MLVVPASGVTLTNALRAAQRIDLGRARLTYVPGFFDQARGEELKLGVVRETELAVRRLRMFGREVEEPRLVGWGGDAAYRYSGRTLEPRPLGGALLELMRLGSEALGALCHGSAVPCEPFNHALVNLYRTGRDSMGLHADDEPELGRDPIVASYSFGAARDFVVHERSSKKRVFTVTLEHGSLLLMERGFQQAYLHGLPRRLGVTEARLNVTLRRILSTGDRLG